MSNTAVIYRVNKFDSTLDISLQYEPMLRYQKLDPWL